MADNADFEWDTVSNADEAQEEIKIKFEEIGDEFIGEFLGYRKLQDRDSGQYYTQARLKQDEEIYFVRANHSLKQGLDQVRPGSMVKITYASDIDTGQASPMRGFTVQVGRSKTVRAAKPTQRAARAADKT